MPIMSSFSCEPSSVSKTLLDTFRAFSTRRLARMPVAPSVPQAPATAYMDSMAQYRAMRTLFAGMASNLISAADATSTEPNIAAETWQSVGKADHHSRFWTYSLHETGIAPLVSEDRNYPMSGDNSYNVAIFRSARSQISPPG